MIEEFGMYKSYNDSYSYFKSIHSTNPLRFITYQKHVKKPYQMHIFHEEDTKSQKTKAWNIFNREKVSKT